MGDKGKGGFLVSKQSYKDFQIRAEFWADHNTWNVYEIMASGPQLTVVLNGVKTADIQDRKFAQGPFALRFGNLPKDAPGGAIKWRKVQVKPL